MTELRPLWRPGWASLGGPPPDDGLLLASLAVPLVRDLNSATWKVSSAGTVAVDGARRPFLVPLRLLEEWLVGGQSAGGAPATGRAVAAKGYSNVAAGIVRADGVPQGTSYGGLRVVNVAQAPGSPSPATLLTLAFDGFQPPGPGGQYVVKALPWPGGGIGVGDAISIALDSFVAQGFVLRVSRGGQSVASVAAQLLLMVEVSQFEP